RTSEMILDMFFGWIIFTLTPLIASGDKEESYCVDVVFVLQTSCNLVSRYDRDIVDDATQIIRRFVDQVSTDKNSTMTLITFDEVAEEVISPQIPSKFLSSLEKGISRGDHCPNNFKAKTADALTLVDSKKYFSVDGKRGKLVVVMSDGISFDMKSNIDVTFKKTENAIGNLRKKGVDFGIFEFYHSIEWGDDDDRRGDDEYSLYNTALRMDFSQDYNLDFVNALRKCKNEDKPVKECRVPTLDLIYVFDRSLSISPDNIEKVKEFLVQLSRKIMAKSKETWIGALSYNYKVFHEFNLRGNDVKRDIEDIVEALENISTSTAEGTYSHKALKVARESIRYLNKEKNRTDALDLIIMITDGVTNISPYLTSSSPRDKFSNFTIKAAKLLKTGKIDLIVVGLPNIQAQRNLNSGDDDEREFAKKKITAANAEWEGMIGAVYPNDPEKKRTNLFTLNSMEELLKEFDSVILDTVCKMESKQ
ncbi:unnamed protein product, partial [Owenia fusiformis]